MLTFVLMSLLAHVTFYLISLLSHLQGMITRHLVGIYNTCKTVIVPYIQYMYLEVSGCHHHAINIRTVLQIGHAI